MTELFKILLEENRAKHERGENASTLELGNCGLTELPLELEQFTWLEHLSLANNNGEGRPIQHSDDYGHVYNSISSIELLPKILPGLKTFLFSGLQITDLAPLSGLDSLHTLHCNNTQVADLAPLASLASLQELHCDNTQVADLAPLAGLTSLQTLDCDNTQVADLAPLASLASLQTLSCNNTQVADLAPLASLTSLQTLSCYNTQVADLAPLASLTSLQTLSCYNTQVADLAPLAGLASLQTLHCDNTQVADLAPLAGLTSLQTLSCYNTQVADLAPLAGLTSLQTLDCDNTQVADLAPLAGLTSLQTLSCNNTQAADLAPLAGLTSLQTLSCYNTQVADLAPLAGLTSLQTLSCYNTQVADLAPLAGLASLQTLSCDNTQVADLAPLAGLASLQTLSCYNTQVADLAPLAGLTSLQTLSCYNTQVADLAPLAGLASLQELHCDNTQVADLAPLAGLTSLQTLSCYNTQVADLAPLAGLTSLQTLSCYNTQVADLAPLAGLASLQTLSCYNTQVADLAPLAGLTSLQTLSCYNTQVADLAPLAGLASLQELHCDNTQVADLAPLAGLTSLQTLSCNNTQVADLAPLASLASLQNLLCNHTQVTDLEPLVNIKKIQVLSVADTHVANLSPLCDLNQMIALDIRRSKVSDLRPILELITRYGASKNDRLSPGLCYLGCPIINPPIEFVHESTEAIHEYFSQLGETGRRLNEVKIIFLGEASSGKTSLVKRLMSERFKEKESQTHGIRIRTLPIKLSDGDVVHAHLWDFGGQEVMHATHQFFLSQRSIYVLLLNSRNDDKAEKWLKHASTFGGQSPVLVVLNKIDENPSFEVERKSLKEKYPQIAGYFRISCSKNRGIKEFKKTLIEVIENAETRRTPFPTNWLDVKQHFSELRSEYDFIESSDYRDVCEESGLSDRFSQSVLLQFLHDLGVVINFRNLAYLDTQILNPLWLTNGVYRIINSGIVADANGILKEKEFNKVVNDPRYSDENTTEYAFDYPVSKLHYIVRVMQEFELCYQLNPTTYVVPQLLPTGELEFNTEGQVIRFEVHFPDFLPESMFPRLMVNLHDFILDDQRWRTGMILSKPSVFEATGRIRWDKEDKKFIIHVFGEDRRRLLSFIRETIKEISTRFKYLELVPIHDTGKFYEYEWLVNAENAGEEEIFIGSLGKKYSVSELLDGIEEPSMRDEHEQKPVKAFVSYSHKDRQYLKDLHSALSPLVRLSKLELWDDRGIDAGEEWEETIFRQLKEADIVLCLVSRDFVASDFCYRREFEVALSAHLRGEKTIIPIRLRSTDWSDLPIAKIQGAPKKWIHSHKNQDEAWTEVSQAIRPALAEAKERRKVLESPF